MSVGNLFDLGLKSYQNLNVNDIVCDTLTAGNLNIDTVNTNIINTNIIRVGEVELTDPLTVDNTQTSVLVRNSITHRIESRIFDKYAPTLRYNASAEASTLDNDPTFKSKVDLNFTPELDGPYLISFNSLFGNVDVLDRGQIEFRYNNVGITDATMDSYNASSPNQNSPFNTFLLFSLIAGVPQTYQIMTRAITGNVRVQQSRIFVQYIGVNL